MPTMRASVGVEATKFFLGERLIGLLLGQINGEHKRLGTTKKCRSRLWDHVCCRPLGHDGFHFSRMVSEGGHKGLTIDNTWRAEED